MEHTPSESDFTKETDTWSVLEQRNENGRRMVVKNDYHPGRALVTGVGPISVKVSCMDDRKSDPKRENPFTSSLLPRYPGKIPSVDNLVPVPCFKGFLCIPVNSAI